MSHELDVGLNRFRRLVEKTPAVGPRLPLIHSTDAYALGNMLDGARQLEPQPCTVFQPERLTYLFYGRPVYRPNQKEDPNDLHHYLPVCLIFKPDADIAIKRLFPFDSGAFQAEFYRSYLHKKMRLGDFLLEPDMDTPGRIVRRFFTDNTNYVTGLSASSEPHDPSQFEAESYARIIDVRGANALDSRGAAIEIQTDQTYDLAGNVEAAIIPSSQARADVGKRLRAAKIKVIPYMVGARPRPGDFASAIEEKCVVYLAKKNLVDEKRL
jgi:hypothetical protein